MKICYWDNLLGQMERESTPEEDAQAALDAVDLTKPIVPLEVTRRQARQALFLNGYLAQVADKINAIPDPTVREMALIEWEDSQTFRRDRPLVNSIGAALGMTKEALDALFIQASTL